MPHKSLIIIIVLLIVAGLAYLGGRTYLQQSAPVTACTQEAKLCPGGSYVGRSGPNCEFAACPEATSTGNATSGGGGILPYTSGIAGVVSLGPTCPVERVPPDPACADKPYATTVTVRHSGSSSIYATAQSDSSGAFKFSLPPGSYTVTAGSGAMLPRCATVNAEVGPSGYVTANISCDTGIR